VPLFFENELDEGTYDSDSDDSDIDVVDITLDTPLPEKNVKNNSKVEFCKNDNIDIPTSNNHVPKGYARRNVKKSTTFVDMLPLSDIPEVKQDVDPKVLEALAIKLKTSLKTMDPDGLDDEAKEGNESFSTEDFKDIILRWNSHRRISLSYETDVFEVWQNMGCTFKSLRKVDQSQNDEKAIGYHVEEESPWLETVQEMRQSRAASVRALFPGDKVSERKKSKTIS